ncbi:MAG: alpha amylase, partial [Pricia sp.]|nr:alpha amylase [Pricia sp.]
MNQASLHQFIASEHKKIAGADDLDGLFRLRLSTNLTLIKDLFFALYPESDHAESFKKLLSLFPALYKKSPNDLKLQDSHRINQGNWYQSEQLAGMQLYVDHFSENLKGLENRLDYFEKLGVNFLHLMPITPRPKGENDGGYA